MKSLINQFISTTLLKEQLRRFSFIGIVGMLTYFFAVMIPFINTGRRIGSSGAQERFIIDILSMQHPIMMIWMVLAPFCVVMALYPFNFSRRVTSAFYTFPITKRQLFWTNFVAGSILMLLPLLILCVFLLIPVYYSPHRMFFADGGYTWSGVWLPPALFPADGLAPGAILNSFGRVSALFGRSVVGLMFYFSVFLLAVSVAGNRVISVFLCVAFPFIPAGVHGLIIGVASFYVFGLSPEFFVGTVEATMTYSNPVFQFAIFERVTNSYFASLFIGRPSAIVHTILYIIMAIGLFAVAYVSSRKRKHERTGDSIVFISFKNVMVFLVSMAGMILMGMFTLAMFGGRVMMYFGFVFGFALAYFIAQMIAEKAFDVRHKIKYLLHFSIVMGGIYVAMLLFTTVGLSGYVNRIPDRADIVGVSVLRPWRGNTAGVTNDPEVIARMTEIHNEILNNRGYIRRTHWNHFASLTWTRNFILPITYRLHDGTYVHREYILPMEFADRVGALALSTEPAIILAQRTALANPEAVESISIEFWAYSREEHTRFEINDPEQVLAMVEAIGIEYIAHRQNTPQGGHFYSPPRQTHVGVNLMMRQGAPDATGVAIRDFSTWLNFVVLNEGPVMELLMEWGYLE